MYKPIRRYVFVGVVGALIELGIFSILVKLHTGIVLSNVVAFHCAFALCYFLHFTYTHEHPLSETKFFARGFMKYAALMYTQLAFGTWMLWVLINQMHWIDEIAKMTQIVAVTPLSYVIQKTFIFRKSKK